MGILWEKYVIKIYYIEGNSKIQGEACVIKDLLGLSVSEKWGNKTKSKINIVENEDFKIERFKSPILFKPIKDNENKYKVYIMNNGFDKSYLGKEFLIQSDDEGDLTLKIPIKFEIDEFLKYLQKKEQKIKKLGDCRIKFYKNVDNFKKTIGF